MPAGPRFQGLGEWLAWQQTLRRIRDTLEEDMDKIG